MKLKASIAGGVLALVAGVACSGTPGPDRAAGTASATTATTAARLTTYPPGSELKCGWWIDEVHGGWSYRGPCRPGTPADRVGLPRNPEIACIPGDPFTSQFPGCR